MFHLTPQVDNGKSNNILIESKTPLATVTDSFPGGVFDGRIV